MSPTPSIPEWRGVIPSEMLYWCVVPPSQSGGRLRQHDLIRYEMEHWAPVDADKLHVVTGRAPSGVQVAVGIERERLRQWLADHTDHLQDAWELVPDRVPPIIDTTLDPAQLSLLTGPFEPAKRRSVRRQLTAILIIAGGIIWTGLIIGMARSESWSRAQLQRQGQAFQERLVAAFPYKPGDSSTSDERLTMAIRQLDVSAGNNGLDVPRLLQQALSTIPPEIRLRVESLSIDRQRFALRFQTLDPVSAERIHAAFQKIAAPAGFRSEPLQVQTTGDIASAIITLVTVSP